MRKEIDVLKSDNSRLTNEINGKVRELGVLTSEYENLRTQNENLKRESEVLKKKLNEAIIELGERDKEIKLAEDILRKWDSERNRLLQENQRLESINRDKTIENDKKAYENSKLMLKLVLAYAEVERLMIHHNI